jgi:hypothetical protein
MAGVVQHFSPRSLVAKVVQSRPPFTTLKPPALAPNRGGSLLAIGLRRAQSSRVSRRVRCRLNSQSPRKGATDAARIRLQRAAGSVAHSGGFRQEGRSPPTYVGGKQTFAPSGAGNITLGFEPSVEDAGLFSVAPAGAFAGTVGAVRGGKLFSSSFRISSRNSLLIPFPLSASIRGSR